LQKQRGLDKFRVQAVLWVRRRLGSGGKEDGCGKSERGFERWVEEKELVLCGKLKQKGVNNWIVKERAQYTKKRIFPHKKQSPKTALFRRGKKKTRFRDVGKKTSARSRLQCDENCQDTEKRSLLN